MQVVRLGESGSALTLASAPEPQPGAGELLIRVFAAAVTPTELLWYPTTHTVSGEVRRNAIPGHEFSGAVAGMGENAGGWELGQEVFGMNDWFADGAMAEYCLAPAQSVALKPAGLSHIEAASVPISALTAWQGLFERLRIQSGERVLVHGGAGSVGGFVVQLARLHGANVIATASAANIPYVTGLGAEQVIDYRTQPFEQQAAQIDAVFDTVGGETLRRSWSVLNPNGRVVTIAAGEGSASEERIRQTFLLVEPKQQQLIEIASLLQSGRLRTSVDAVVPLSQAPEAYAGRVSRQHRGKVVVTIAENNDRGSKQGGVK